MTIKYDQNLLVDFEAGIDPLDPEHSKIPAQSGNIVVYIIQQKFDPRTLAHLAIHSLPTSEVERIFNTILEQIGRGRSPGRAIEN